MFDLLMDNDTYQAAKEGNIDGLQRIEDLCLSSPMGNTFLHIYVACQTSTDPVEVLKSTDTVKRILQECPALLMQQNKSGETALHIAAKHGRAAIAKVLIDQVAKAKNGNDLEEGVSATEAFLSAQKFIRKTNKEKDTALHEAARFNHLNVVELLIGGDREFSCSHNNAGKNPPSSVVNKVFDELFSRISLILGNPTYQGPDRRFSYSPNNAGETPLYLAAERGHHELVSKILHFCQNPTYQGPDGRTALHAAVICNHEEITIKLLEHEGWTAPRSERWNYNLSSELTDVVDTRGWTPLHWAVFLGHTSIVKRLLLSNKRAAYIGDKEDKKTALHIAASKGHVDIMKELLYHCPGCCELVDKRGRNILHYAIENHKFEIERLVRGDPWLSNVLLNGKDVDGNTPLHQLTASLYGGTEFISDPRVDKMAFNKNNQTAFDNIPTDKTFPVQQEDPLHVLKNNGGRPGHRIVRNVENKDDESINESKEAKNAYLIVATLIATVTFAAGFTMPGGYQNDKGPDQGFAVLTRNFAFKVFIIANSIAMSASTASVFMHLFLSIQTKAKSIETKTRRINKGRLQNAVLCTLVALVTMVVAFAAGTYAVLGYSSELAITSCMLSCSYFFCLYFSEILRKLLVTCQKYSIFN